MQSVKDKIQLSQSLAHAARWHTLAAASALPSVFENLSLTVVPKLEKHGIKYVTRGGRAKPLIGELPKNGLVITQAKDMDSVLAFWNDSKRLSEHRH